MPSAEIIAIGSELLLGETLDTNTQFLLQHLRKIGVDVFRTLIIGDNAKRISAVIKEAFTRADIVITTGGLGPTIDDPTREAVSLAFDCNLVYKEELWEEITTYFAKMTRQPSLNNKRQAYIPAIANAISNPTGTAPSFFIHKGGKFLVSLPGVPTEMKYIFTESVLPLLTHLYSTSDCCILMSVLHSFGISESKIDELVGDMEESSNPTLGLCAKNSQIDLRIAAKAKSTREAQTLVDSFEDVLREKLGNAIFGKDEDTLYSVVDKLLTQTGAKVRILENNSAGKLREVIDPGSITNTMLITSETPENYINAFLADESDSSIAIVFSLVSPDNGFIQNEIYVKNKDKLIHKSRSYNPLSYEEQAPILLALNTLRLILLQA